MQQALALRDYYSPQQVAKELLHSLKLPANAEIYARARLRNSDKKSYSTADVFDLLKKVKAKFGLNKDINFLLPNCALCFESLTEENVASSSEKFVCAGHSERFCKECLSNTLLDKCPFCRSIKIADCPHEALIFMAAQFGRKDLIKKLISEQSINVNAAQADGFTPLMLTSQQGHIAIVKLLIDNGANVKAVAKGLKNITALHQACQNGHTDISELLIDKDADVNAIRTDGFTPLMFAACYGYLTTVKLLLKNHANVHAERNNDSKPLALIFARQQGYQDICRLIEDIIQRRNNV